MADKHGADRIMHVGDKVIYKNGDDLVKYGARYNGEERGLTAGLYTLVATDEYLMCGMVEIEDVQGRRFGIDAALIDFAPEE